MGIGVGSFSEWGTFDCAVCSNILAESPSPHSADADHPSNTPSAPPTPPAPPPTPPPPTPPPPPFSSPFSLGSYVDKDQNHGGQRGLPCEGPWNTANNYTLETCQEYCSNYKFFGLQAHDESTGSQCFCGNDFARATQYGAATNDCAHTDCVSEPRQPCHCALGLPVLLRCLPCACGVVLTAKRSRQACPW